MAQNGMPIQMDSTIQSYYHFQSFRYMIETFNQHDACARTLYSRAKESIILSTRPSYLNVDQTFTSQIRIKYRRQSAFTYKNLFLPCRIL
jgi:hypothetical protein